MEAFLIYYAHQSQKEGIPTESRSKDDTPAPNLIVYLPIIAGCVSAAMMTNGLLVLGGLVMSVLLMVADL
ncbi:MAG: hypothetical protein MJ077_00880 [Oscillospiraceae bacterium]|nr:hypothetical protein [Oscillospiraceae bacterium]